MGRVLIGRNPFDLAYYFCKGIGLEVGARNNPYPFGRRCKVFYADIRDETEIKEILNKGFRIGPAFGANKYAVIDHVLSAPKYGFDDVKDGAFDFVYSDNVLEHTPNPIFSLIEQLRVTKNGGFVYVVIPNKNFTFDRDRISTPVNVLIDKYQNDIFDYSIDEALDVIRNTQNFPRNFMGDDTELDFAEKMIAVSDGSYHFHVFDIQNTLGMLRYVCEITSSSLQYFSAPDGKHIHFAVCKGVNSI